MQLNYYMTTFALCKIEAIQGQQEFDKLIINDRCPFDEFENTVKSLYPSELISIYRCMQDVANLKSLPFAKFHFYDKGTNGIREFEFKSKHLRVYGITKPNGKIIITGGTKSKQKKDQNEFRHIKDQYLASLK